MKRFLASLALAFAVACSGDSGTNPNPGNGNTGGGGGKPTAADSVRVAVLDSIETHMEGMAAMDEPSRAAALVPYLQSIPDIHDAKITTGTTTVYAHFKDGRLLIIPNNRDFSSESDTLVVSQYAPQGGTPPAPPRHVVIPSGKEVARLAKLQQTSGRQLPVSMQYRAFRGIGTCHINPLPAIRALLGEQKYYPAPSGSPTVLGLKGIRNDGFFYLDTHGGLGTRVDSLQVMALWTTDEKTTQNEASFRSMLNAYDVVYMIDYVADRVSGGCPAVTHYGITSSFVSKYMHFAKNSLVYIDACYSGDANLQTAFATAGAGTYVGWSKSVSDPFAYAAAKYMLDRLLGTNKTPPIESPKQRAFPIDLIMTDMARVHLVVDPGTGAVLTATHLNGDFGLLAPTIKYLSIEEPAGRTELYVAGVFGDDPGSKGQVWINDTEKLDIIQWTPDYIRCDLPATGDNSAGSIQVYVNETDGPGSPPLGRASNKVNLTQWRGQVRYKRTEPGTLESHMALNVHIRADVHPFRDLPHETPNKTTVLFRDTRDGDGTAGASGTHDIPQGQCAIRLTYAGSATFGPPYQVQNDANWQYYGSVDTQNHQLRLDIEASAAFSQYGSWQYVGSGCPPNVFEWGVQAAFDDCLYDDLVQTHAFLIPVRADDWAFVGNSRSCQPPTYYGQVFPDGYPADVKAEWDTFLADFPPDTTEAQ